MVLKVSRTSPETATLSPPLEIERDQTGIGKEVYYFINDATESFAQSGIVVALQKQIAAHIWETRFKSGCIPSVVDYLGSWSFPTIISINNLNIDLLKSEQRELRQYDYVLAQLKLAFDLEPVEDGISHEAEIILQQQIESRDETNILRQLSCLVLSTESPSFTSSVLRCLGRRTDLGSRHWRTELIRDALSQDNLEIRDAAVQTAELWGGSDMRLILENHRETVSWLRDYISEVIDYLVD